MGRHWSCFLASFFSCSLLLYCLFNITSLTSLHVQIWFTLSHFEPFARSYKKLLFIFLSSHMALAANIWEDILIDHPLDMLALKFAHDSYFYLGQSNQIRDSIARVLKHYQPSNPFYGLVCNIWCVCVYVHSSIKWVLVCVYKVKVQVVCDLSAIEEWGIAFILMAV